MARRKRKSRKKSGLGVSTLFKFIRLGALGGPALNRFSEMRAKVSQDPIKAGGLTLISYGGIDSTMKFNPSLLGRMWIPYLVTSAITAGIPKITGMIRRI